MPVKKCWVLGFVSVAIIGCILGPPGAIADDANAVPPRIELWPGGEPQGTIGSKDSEFGAYYEALAYFATAEPDDSWAYAVGSTVSFACLLDSQPMECASQLYPCCRAIVGVRRDGRAFRLPAVQGETDPRRRSKLCLTPG